MALRRFDRAFHDRKFGDAKWRQLIGPGNQDSDVEGILEQMGRLDGLLDCAGVSDLLEPFFFDDRRGVLARLTDAGYALLERAAPNHVTEVRRAFVDVVAPEDFEALGRAFRAVLDAD